ncbi:MAG: YhjD/YihY/BrkB family envelope integrity protein [Phycisphaerae bacterium]
MIRESVQRAVERWLTQPGRELSRTAQLVSLQVQLWRFCARRLRENNVMAMSAALSFRTIFALIPTLVLAFLAARAVGALADSRASLTKFLSVSGLAQITYREPEGPPAELAGDAPAERGLNVADEILAAVDRVQSKLTFQRVGPIGGMLFIWTAITLLTTIERSLNRVFGAPRSRGAPRRVLLYWSAMTLGPLLLAVASHLGTRVIDAFRGQPGVSWLLVLVGWLGPIAVGVIVVAGIYVFMPNTRVDPRAALGGAAVAVALWLFAKWGFSTYVQRLVLRGNLYGVLGVFPLFMMWLNLSWMIFLFGAELTHAAANVGKVRWGDRHDNSFLSPADALAVALAVARSFRAGRGPVEADQLARALNMPAHAVRWILARFERQGLVCPVTVGRNPTRFALVAPAERVRVAEVLAVAELRDLSFADNGRSADIDELIARFRDRMHGGVSDVTLADLLHDLKDG